MHDYIRKHPEECSATDEARRPVECSASIIHVLFVFFYNGPMMTTGQISPLEKCFCGSRLMANAYYDHGGAGSPATPRNNGASFFWWGNTTRQLDMAMTCMAFTRHHVITHGQVSATVYEAASLKNDCGRIDTMGYSY